MFAVKLISIFERSLFRKLCTETQFGIKTAANTLQFPLQVADDKKFQRVPLRENLPKQLVAVIKQCFLVFAAYSFVGGALSKTGTRNLCDSEKAVEIKGNGSIDLSGRRC